MNLSSHLIQRLLRLDPPQTRDLVTERDLRVPMPDGAVLLADRYAPRGADPSLPTALIRSPYGRRGLIAAGIARPLAERGFQVLMQSTRGTFGSGGVLDPFRHEREDGLATLEWVVKQPWFGGTIVLAGGSYLGYVQWAVADSLPPEVKAMIPQVTESALTLEFLRKDGLSLETPFSWGVMVAGQERRLGMLRGMAHARKNRRALSTLPLGEADVAAIGRHSDYVQDVLACDADQPRWAGIDHRHRVAQVSVPVCSIGGWYDIFLPGQLRDFRILQEAGRPARLMVGPWTHISADGTPLRESIEFGLAHARGDQPPPRPPVRLYVMGEEAWRDFDSWPPPGYPPQLFHLQPGGALSVQPVKGDGEAGGESAADRYRYDPADPTPAVGGVRMGRGSGRVDNTALEARPPHQAPGLERRVPALRPQPRHRRAAPHRDPPAGRRPGGLPRRDAPLGRHPARPAGVTAAPCPPPAMTAGGMIGPAGVSAETPAGGALPGAVSSGEKIFPSGNAIRNHRQPPAASASAPARPGD